MNTEQIDTSPPLWKAVWQLAGAWSATPIVQAVSAALPRNRPITDVMAGADGVPALLHDLGTMVGGLMHPLMYGSRIPQLLENPMIASHGLPKVNESDLKEWLRDAGKLELAHRLTLGWLRSSLAGYPVLRVPQLAPGTPFTTTEMPQHFTWSKQELASGLNRYAAPPHVPQLLGADECARTALDEAAGELSAQLRLSPAWLAFEGASTALDDGAKAELRAARLELKLRLSEERLQEHEPTLIVPRSRYRARTTNEVVEALTGAAESYAHAFNDVHELLTLSACDALSEIALYGEPWSIDAKNLEASMPGQPIIDFESAVPTGPFVSPGQILWLSESLVTDAVRIERHTLQMDLAQSPRDQFTARVLLGTADAWPRASR